MERPSVKIRELTAKIVVFHRYGMAGSSIVLQYGSYKGLLVEPKLQMGLLLWIMKQESKNQNKKVTAQKLEFEAKEQNMQSHPPKSLQRQFFKI